MTSIFLDFALPNSSTWFYWSLMLAVALFFQFHRWFSLRNLDLIALFFFAPGFLLVQQAHMIESVEGLGTAQMTRYVGYGVLMGASLFWFIRCLTGLIVERRPKPLPNLTAPGLIWFTVALALVLVGSAFMRSANPWEPVGKPSALVSVAQAEASTVVAKSGTTPNHEPSEVAHLVESIMALLCHLAVVLGLIFIGWVQFGSALIGVSAGALYLLLPYTAYHIGQIHHVLPAGLIVWALYFYRRPTVCGVFVGLATGTLFFPVLLLPVFIQFYMKYGLSRFFMGFLLASLVSLSVVVWLLTTQDYALGQLAQIMRLDDWIPWQVSNTESIWQGSHWAYRIPIFIMYLGFVVTLCLWPPVKNLGHLIAMCAGVLIGIQFWFADRGGLYVLWFQPLLVLMVLRTNLADHVALDPGPPPRLWAWTHRQNVKTAETNLLTEKPGTA